MKRTPRPLTGIERVLSFWLSFGIAYCAMRWVFCIGHLAAAVAYVESTISVGITQLDLRLRS